MQLERWWPGALPLSALCGQIDRPITVWNCLPHQGCQVHLEQGKRYCRCQYPRDPERINIFWSGENVIPNLALFDACFAQERLDGNHRVPFWAIAATDGARVWFGSEINWENEPAMLPHRLRNPLKELSQQQASELMEGRDIDIAFVSRSEEEFRIQLVRDLQQQFSVTCAGTVLNNAPIAEGSFLDLVHFYRRCRLVVACENSASDGYCTEKLFLPVVAGAIPLYWGDERVELDWNMDAIVSLKNGIPFDRIRQLLDSPSLQQEMLQKAVLKVSPNVIVNQFSEVCEQLADPRPTRIALLTTVSSLGRDWKTPEESPLYRELFESLKKVAEPGFSYTVFVGVDQEDPLFKAKIARYETMVSANQWLIRIQWVGLSGDAWNQLFEFAYNQQFDYFCQVSDNRLLENFTSLALAKLTESNGFGVVGPSGARAKQRVVSCKHMILFGYFYPAELECADDWFSKVYPSELQHSFSENINFETLVARDKSKVEIGMPILLRYQTLASAQTPGLP